MLRIVSNYQIPEIVNYLTGCSASSGTHSGTSGDPNKVQNPPPCSGTSINSSNEKKKQDYCGYFH